MNKQLHIKSNKQDVLIDLLLKTPDKRRKHFLYLTSCYFTPASAQKIIDDLDGSIRLSCVTIYIDRKTAISLGYEALNNICKTDKIKLFAVNTECLFHSKAYALISFDQDDANNEIRCGSLVVGSANLTQTGLSSKNGNIECLLDTQNNELINEFFGQIKKLSHINIKDIEKFKPKERDTYSFKYALMQRGAFVHRWLVDLGQYFSVRYRLSELGKEKIGDPIFRNRGFEIETATISKRYFHFDYDPPHLENTRNLIKRYGIETYLGHWVPRNVLGDLVNPEGIEDFKSKLFTSLAYQSETIKQEIQHDMEYFKKAGILDEDDTSSVDIFEKKVIDLQENDYKVKRIFNKFEVFDLPYDLREKERINDVFYEIIELCESRKTRNAAMKGFLSAYANADLDMLDKEL